MFNKLPSCYLSVAKWLICCLLWLIALPALLLAEGSKDLNASGGSRAYLYSSTVGNASFPFPTQGTMKVYAKVGESIYMGSSAQGIGSGTMVIRAPDGKTYTSGTSATVGLILNRSQEVAGPAPNPGGYTPYIQPVLAGQEGVWEVDFIPVSQASSNPVPIPSNLDWTQPGGPYVAAFDITVRGTTNTFLTGRVYTNIFMGLLNAYDIGFNAIVKVLTKDGYLYNLDNNGQAGDGFSFFANNKGFKNANGTPSYKSVDNVTSFNVQDPRAADTQSDVTHKIFFNTPAADLPAVANTPGNASTWLLNTPFVPTISNVTFTGMEGTAGKAGTSPLGGNISFTTTGNGAYTISIDINKNGVFTDAVDRKLTGTINAGVNTVYWDGLDGLGNKATASVSVYNINITANVYAGEVHFPFFDVERNVNGIILTRLNGFAAPDYTVFWDDSPVTTFGTPSLPVTNLVGLSSLVNGHKWGTPGAGALEFGNEKSIDTWAYVSAAPLLASLSFQLQEADLQVTSVLATTPICIGQPFTATVSIKNNGPSDVSGAKVNLTYPGVLSNISVSSAATSGISSLSATTTSATAYSATLNINNGAVITLIINGTAASTTVTGSNAITASILRPADLTDPDATNPDAAPPTDANAECDSPPSGVGCNNIRSLAVTILAKPVAGKKQTIVKNTTVTLTGVGTGVWSQAGALPAVANITSPASITTTVTGFTTAGTYKFVYTNAASCTDTVAVITLDAINIPNIITPNGDGKNDVLEITGLSSYPNSELIIFNRWGAEIYRSANYLNNWDGNGLAEGTYFYILNRKEPTGGTTTFKGWVYLKR
jgi:gliding motility-associated-like protein